MSQTVVTTYKTIQCHNWEGQNKHFHCHRNIKSYPKDESLCLLHILHPTHASHRNFFWKEVVLCVLFILGQIVQTPVEIIFVTMMKYLFSLLLPPASSLHILLCYLRKLWYFHPYFNIRTVCYKCSQSDVNQYFTSLTGLKYFVFSCSTSYLRKNSIFLYVPCLW